MSLTTKHVVIKLRNHVHKDEYGLFFSSCLYSKDQCCDLQCNFSNEDKTEVLSFKFSSKLQYIMCQHLGIKILISALI